MGMTARLVVAMALSLIAAVAAAQPANDPIGALLDTPGRPTPELEEPDTAAAPVEIEPEPSLAASRAPVPAPPPAPRLTAPVNISETGKTPDSPPSVRDLAYESRIRSSVASAQSFQGPLDGSWTLLAGGTELYALQLVDRGAGVVEGAWRDLRRVGAIGASGFFDQIESQGPDLTLRFTPASGASAEAVLHSAYAGWTGEFIEGGARRPVELRRRN